MNLKQKIIWIIFIGLGVVSLYAQTDSQKTILKKLLSVNPEVQASDLKVKASNETIKTAGVLPDPKLELATSISPVETRNGPIENQLMLGQMFPLWGKLSRQQKLAVISRDMIIQNNRQTRLSVIQQFEIALANYNRITHSLKILDRYAKELESFQKIALTQYSTGQGLTQHPILKLQIEQTRVHTKTNDLNSQLESVWQSINRLFAGNLDSAEMASIEWQNLTDLTLTNWLDQANAGNPALASAKLRTEMTTVSRELSQKQNLPDLTAGLTYSVIGPTDLPGSVSPGKDAIGVKFGLNLPVWFKRNKARVEAAKKSEQSAAVHYQDTQNRVDESIRSIVADLRETRETVALYENRLIPEAEQMQASAFAGYKTGKISFLDLLDSERMVVTLRLDYEKTLAKEKIGEANLRKAAGQLEGEN